MNKAHENINWENYPSDNTALNAENLNKMDVAIDNIDNRVVSLDSSKATKTEVSTLVADVSFEESTGIITVTKKNGSKITIDTQMEKIAVNFSYDRITQQIILTLIDGAKQYIDLSALITQYEFIDSDTIAFSIDSDGKVTAKIKEGSITEKYLEQNYLSNIKVEVEKTATNAKTASEAAVSATASKTAAATSEKNAKTSEINATNASDNAMQSAESAIDSMTAAAASQKSANTSAVNAKASEDAASTSATNAKASETAAANSAKTIAGKVEAASTSATNAKASETNASTSATKAQSYAVGGTGTRTNEDTDNAKYYSQQATNKASAASVSATNAKASEANAAASAKTATDKASTASASATTASNKATSANNSASAAAASQKLASTSESNAASSATLAYNYAVGESNSAKYYAEQAKSVSESLKGSLKPMGTVTFANLPALSTVSAGDMYNVSTSFTTTSSFKEGAGNIIAEGANVYKTADGYWDILAGTPVAGVKGNAESTYRTGNVNITPTDIGALSTTGEASNTTVKFTESTSRTKPTTGEKLSSIVGKIVKFLSDLKTVAFSGSYNDLSNKPTSLPANGGNSATVNGHTVNEDVPSGAKFTDTHVTVADNLTSTSTTSALSANQGRILKNGLDEVNQRLDGVLDITAQKYYSNSKTYLNFYYDKATSYFGIIYNLSSNNINGVRPILFTLRISYDGTQIKFDQINEALGATLNVNKATNNTYVSFEINQTSDKKNLSYLQLWITKIK